MTDQKYKNYSGDTWDRTGYGGSEQGRHRPRTDAPPNVPVEGDGQVCTIESTSTITGHKSEGSPMGRKTAIDAARDGQSRLPELRYKVKCPTAPTS